MNTLSSFMLRLDWTVKMAQMEEADPLMDPLDLAEVSATEAAVPAGIPCQLRWGISCFQPVVRIWWVVSRNIRPKEVRGAGVDQEDLVRLVV